MRQENGKGKRNEYCLPSRIEEREMDMKVFRKKKGPGALSLLYDEARLEPSVRKGLNWIMGGNLCGNLHGTICGGGTAAMVGLAGLLGAGDMEFGCWWLSRRLQRFCRSPFPYG